MFRNRLFNLAWLSLALLSVVPLSQGSILPQSNNELNVKSAPIGIETLGADFTQQSDWVPDQGRPDGRLRGGSSR